MTPPEVEALAGWCPQRVLPAGECLFRRGDLLDCVYVVRQGTVGVGHRSKGRRLTLLLMGEGEIVGDEALLSDSPAAFDAFAVGDATLVAVPAPSFLQAVTSDSVFSRRWARGVSRRLSALQGRLEDLLAGDLRAQVASLVLHELTRSSRALSLTQQTIADLLGVQRTSVGRVLRELEGRGILEVGYAHIAVRDRRALAAIAGTAAGPGRAGA